MKSLSLHNLNGIFNYLNAVPSTVLWIKDRKYEEQLYLGENFESIWGHPCSLLYEYPEVWADLLLKADNTYITPKVDNRVQLTKTSDPDVILYRILSAEGKVKFIKDEAFVLVDNDENPISFMGIAQSISEQQWHTETDNHSDLQKNNMLFDLKKDLFDILQKELLLNAKPQLALRPSQKIKKAELLLEDKLKQLTEREKECLHHLASGKNIKLIASMLDISPRTVETHLIHIKTKLGCRSNMELVSHFFTQ